jgi:hypothetical protein
LYYGAAKLSLPPEPYDPEADPAPKGALDLIRIANKAMNMLLNEAADKVLKEDD